MDHTYAVPYTSTATQYAHPPSLLGRDHMQSAGLVVLQLLFLQRSLQDKGCYSPSDQNLFNAVYQAAQAEKLSCNKALAAKHEEVVTVQRKLGSVCKRSPDQGDPKSCVQDVFPNQRQQKLHNHTSRSVVQKPTQVKQGKEINLIESMTEFLDAFSNHTGGLCNKDSALITAVRLGDAVVTQLILDAGADISAVPMRANPYQRTALHWAAAAGHKNVTEVLLEYGAKLEAKTLGGATPLLLAVRDNADKAVIRMLLQNGADIDARDNQGRTALHVAAQTGDIDLMQLLVEYGADPQAGYSKQHITPRQLAALHGHSDLADWLKQFENQHTTSKPNKTHRMSMEWQLHSPLYRQLPFPENDTAVDGVPDKFHSEESNSSMSKAFLVDSKDPETHIPPLTTAAKVFSNATHLSDFGHSEDQEEFTKMPHSPEK